MSGRWATTQWKRCESWRCIEVWRTGEETLQECKSRLYKGCGFFVSLQDRANIANKAKGDLFVSIHTNSVDKNRQAAIRSLGRKHIHWDCIGLMKTLR